MRGHVGGALEFDGEDDYVGLPEGFADFTGGFTVAVWAYPMAVKNWGRFVDLGNGPGTNVIALARHKALSDLVLLVENRPKLWRGLTAAGALRLYEWQHFAATIDERGNAVVYRNGTAVQVGNVGVPARAERVRNYIARSNYAQDSYYAGGMDDVRIYDRALSADEIIILADPALLAAAEKAEKRIARKAAPAGSPFDRFLAGFDALVGKGDHPGVGKLVREAAKDPGLAGRAAAKAANGLAGQEVKLETREGQAKGKVKEASADGLVVLEEIVINRVSMGATKRAVRWADVSPEQATELAEAGGWKPRTPDDHVALAVLAVLWRKYEAAAESLDAAGGHPLVEHYRARIRRE
ncbi:MAG: LamG domain-containing protein [Planctomycetota bacterium]